MSTPPSFTQADFAQWNQTTSVFYLPKRLVGKSKVTQLRTELVKTIGESKVSAVQALPGLKFRVCFTSPSVRSSYHINGLTFRGLTITPFLAYEEVKAVFADRAPPQMPDKFLYKIRLFQLKFASRGFSFRFVTADSLLLALCARRWGTLQRTVQSCRHVLIRAVQLRLSLQRLVNSQPEPAGSGSSKPSSSSSSHPRDLCEKLAHPKSTAVTPVGAVEDPVTLLAPQPQSPLVEVVDVVLEATSRPGHHRLRL